MDSPSQPAIALPDVPAFALHGRGGVLLTRDGEIETLDGHEAAARIVRDLPLLVSMPTAARRLKVRRFAAHDLLELFAFVRPARFCLPTLDGLAAALDLPPAGSPPDPLRLLQIAEILLGELGHLDRRTTERAATLAQAMADGDWPWAVPVLKALGQGGSKSRFRGLDAWSVLPEPVDPAPPPPPSSLPVEADEAADRLSAMLGPDAERRQGQYDYAARAAHAFRPRERQDEPQVVLAEAGTGTGKTLGYVAPASVWAQKNGGAVWVSTYTKNLQRQLDQELDRLYPDPRVKAEKAVIRKGRENYLCLLNFQEAVQGGAARRADIVPLALMARWIEATRDGDLGGGDFPSWLVTLFGSDRTVALADRRGECVFSACEHYRKCFIETARRKSTRAEIVVANHALVLSRAVQLSAEESAAKRYVFDEGHHLFDAADSAFSAELSGMETAELRRWIRGAEDGRRGRARGLTRRVEDLIAGDETAKAALDRATHAARKLPGFDWLTRLKAENPAGVAEAFLTKLRQQVLARTGEPDNPYGLECETAPPVDGLTAAAAELASALGDIKAPLTDLKMALAKRLEDETDELSTGERVRIEAAINGIEYRCEMVLSAWISMLQGIGAGPADGFVDWFSLRRVGGREADAAYHRHMIDPTEPFAETVLKPAHGALITSASLRDRSGEGDDWSTAEARTGLTHLVNPASRISVPSPFDYGAATRIFVVGDVRRDRPDEIAAAYRELFLAAGGGALGLFTAIQRLRNVHERIVEPLETAGLPLYAQHVDPIDTPTLVDIFRAEEDSCLLGTDAVRDGVDVPGQSLRLIVFDRVPWPRPDILHKARRKAFGGRQYDDMLIRLKLKQAYGRLLRRAGDRGVFVMLDPMLPSRLCDAFPTDVEIHRTGIAEAVKAAKSFLSDNQGEPANGRQDERA
ncbi:MAG: ATP-dependent DNA helicase [Minwuia sp.]|uniref:ATP-dependent DNA helicase n=1 Tax=Minwuia sp. TaxID=2493630 RepID=UPI003A85F748